MKYALAFLLFIYACSGPVEHVQPSTPVESRSVDLGASPLMHSADTTVTVALAPRGAAIIAITISNPNFTLLDTARAGDSLRITFRFMPEQVGAVRADCFALSSKDTLARIILHGEGMPFEYRIGDSYIFQNDSTGKIDSVWVSRLPLHFSTSDSTTIDWTFRSIIDRDSIWTCLFYGGQYGVVGDSMPQQFQIATTSPFSVYKEWTYIWDSNSPIGGSYHRYSADSRSLVGYRIDTVETKPFLADQIIARAGIYEKMRFVDFSGSESFTADYSPALGFFISIVDTVHHEGYAASSYINETKGTALRLLRYHLRR